jgi:hypothetical protein
MRLDEALDKKVFEKMPPHIEAIFNKLRDPNQNVKGSEMKILKDWLLGASPETKKYFKKTWMAKKKKGVDDSDAEYELHQKLPEYPSAWSAHDTYPPRWQTFDTPG